MVTVAYVWYFDVFVIEFDGVAFSIVDLVLEVAAAFDFPAVVYVSAACEAANGDCAKAG